VVVEGPEEVLNPPWRWLTEWRKRTVRNEVEEERIAHHAEFTLLLLLLLPSPRARSTIEKKKRTAEAEMTAIGNSGECLAVVTMEFPDESFFIEEKEDDFTTLETRNNRKVQFSVALEVGVDDVM